MRNSATRTKPRQLPVRARFQQRADYIRTTKRHRYLQQRVPGRIPSIRIHPVRPKQDPYPEQVGRIRPDSIQQYRILIQHAATIRKQYVARVFANAVSKAVVLGHSGDALATAFQINGVRRHPTAVPARRRRARTPVRGAQRQARTKAAIRHRQRSPIRQQTRRTRRRTDRMLRRSPRATFPLFAQIRRHRFQRRVVRRIRRQRVRIPTLRQIIQRRPSAPVRPIPDSRQRRRLAKGEQNLRRSRPIRRGCPHRPARAE